ncbi:hypothetical protein Pyn_41258 [Prunus yedoensis var. nudiflora]|uniref:Uncharacterized protein n=1 Tax=Prunus yedoensis var. nudiflora TaxID=2094558 RepID=A0A314XHT1_PRUYE|nr:hypothetical protein Pyn_41258 [Prunus yedoensis var. nudiflora]
MARGAYVVLGGGHAEELGIMQDNSGGILLLCMILMSLSLISMVIFACGDDEGSSKKRYGGGGGGGCGGGGGGGGGGGALHHSAKAAARAEFSLGLAWARGTQLLPGLDLSRLRGFGLPWGPSARFGWKAGVALTPPPDPTT